MKSKRFPVEQIVAIVKQAEAGGVVPASGDQRANLTGTCGPAATQWGWNIRSSTVFAHLRARRLQA